MTFLLHLSDISGQEAAGPPSRRESGIERSLPVIPVTEQRGTACEKER
jgi:hypothetical protein